jgi:photosystem II stability/assembly factor-like uncharacterized protein
MTKPLTFLKWIIRLSLFGLILGLGTMAALQVDETKSLARIDLSDAPVQTMTKPNGTETLYASVSGDTPTAGFYRSADNGHTWENIGAGPDVANSLMTVQPDDEAVLYAGGVGGPLETTKNLWRSKDGGQTWNKFNLNLPANPDHILPDITAMTVDPQQPGVLYVGTGGQGIYRFETNHLGYELVGGTSLYNAQVKSVVVGADSQLFTLTTDGLFTTSEDKPWQQITAPDYPTSLAVSLEKGQTLYMGSVSTGVYRSQDEGKTWENLSKGLDLIPGAALRVTTLGVDEAHADHVAIATAYGVGSHLAPGHLYESTDGGEQWTEVAELKQLVTELTLNRGMLHAMTSDGLVSYQGQLYQEPVVPVSALASQLGLEGLSQPSGSQLLILVLTVSLATLVLLKPVQWLRLE